MSWFYSYNPDIWPAVIVFFIVAYLGWYGWQRRSIPAARYFAVGCFLGVLWALGTILEISAVDPSTQIFWFKFQVAWFVPIGTAMPCFILVYAGLGYWLTRRNLILLSIPPLIFLGLIWTNNYHQLVWTGFQLGKYIMASPGTANRIFIIYVYVLGLIMFAILIWLAIRSPQHRRPALIMLFGQIIGRLVYILDYFSGGFLGPGESLMVVLGVTSASYGIALFRFHVLDPIPLARTAVIDQMQEGMLVLDLQKRIVDLNPEATEMLGNSEANLRGHNIKEVLPANLNLDRIDKVNTLALEFNLVTNKNLRHFILDTTSLSDKYGHVLGYLMLLHDVTEQKRAQVQLIEQQSALAILKERERLARELHDSVGQVLGYVDLQSQTIRKLVRAGKNAEAEPEFSKLIEAARDAHTDVRESILNLKNGTGAEWSFLPVLKQYLNDFQSRHGIHIELTVPEGFKDNIYDSGTGVQLLRVIQEALTNARKHSKAKTARIDITLDDSWVHISITDDGMGFNTRIVNQDRSQHFGLDFMRERMEQIGGSMVIESRPGAGTIINLKTPIKNHVEKKI